MAVRLNKFRSKFINLKEEIDKYIIDMEEDLEKCGEDEEEEASQLGEAKDSMNRVLEHLSSAIDHLGGE